jgi:hypothetical protein
MRLPEQMFIQSRIDDFIREAEHERLVRLVRANPADLLRKYGEALVKGKEQGDDKAKTPEVSKN